MIWKVASAKKVEGQSEGATLKTHKKLQVHIAYCLIGSKFIALERQFIYILCCLCHVIFIKKCFEVAVCQEFFIH